MFWGVGAEAPGWLVGCLSEFAAREVNLTRIESRPRKQGLGRYMFFVDLEGRDTEPHVADGARRPRASASRCCGCWARSRRALSGGRRRHPVDGGGSARARIGTLARQRMATSVTSASVVRVASRAPAARA